MTTAAYVAHALPGRIRIKVPACRGQETVLAGFAEILSRAEGVLEVVANPRTGSLLVHHTARVGVGDIGAFAARHRLFRLAEPVLPVPRDVPEMVRLGGATLNAGLRSLTHGEVDIRTASFVALVVMALIQLARGQVMAPATTLLWTAYELVDGRRGSAQEPP
jgi:hypothetical protein